MRLPAEAAPSAGGRANGGSGGAGATTAGAGGASGGAGGSSGGAGGSSGGAGGSSGGAGGSSGGAGGSSGAGGAIDAGRDTSVSDAPVTDARADSTPDSMGADAGCRGPAGALCPVGSWRRYGADGGAVCAACPGPTLTCAAFDLAASTFTAGNPKRIIKVALAPDAAEILMDGDVRVRATYEGTSCGGSHIVTTFAKNNITVEHDSTGRTFYSVDIGLINVTMVPCGDIGFSFNDGCCTHQEAHVSAVYDEGSGTTTFSCVDAG